MPESTLTPTTPDGIRRRRAAWRIRAALRRGERLWASGEGSGEIDAIRLRKGRLEGRWRWLARWERLHTVWQWGADDQEEILYDEP